MNKIDFNMDAQESSGLLLWQLTNLWQTGIRKLLEDFSLTHPQFVVLASTAWLLRTQSEVNQKMVSDFTKIDPMTTSVVVRGLEKKGFLLRETAPKDSRAYILSVTDTGSKNLKQAMNAVDWYDAEFFGKIGADNKVFNYITHRLIAENLSN